MTAQQVIDKLDTDLCYTDPEMRSWKATLYLQQYPEYESAIIYWLAREYPELIRSSSPIRLSRCARRVTTE